MKIHSINISKEHKLENHNVNSNEEGQPKEVNGKTAISGQKLRHSIFENIEVLNKQDSNKGNTYLSNADGVTCDISTDLRSDFGGYMDTSDMSFANKRKSPINVAYAVSKHKNNFFDDLFVRFSNSPTTTKHNKQRINTKSYSAEDIITTNYSLDCLMLSTTKYFTYTDEKHISSEYVKHVDEKERKRRAILFLKGSRNLSGMANQARNAISTRPKKVFISFDTINTFEKYFDLNVDEQKSYLKELDRRNVKYIIGDDNSNYSVDSAYAEAEQFLIENELVDYSDGVALTQEKAEAKFVASAATKLTKAKNTSKKKDVVDGTKDRT